MFSYVAIYDEVSVFCAVLIMVFIIHSYAGLGNTIRRKRFVAAMITLVIFFLSDAVWYSMDSGLISQNYSVNIILKTIYFLSASFNGYFWFLYFETEMDSVIAKKKKYIYISAIPAVIHIVLCIINVFTGILFFVERPNFRYDRGALFMLQYVIIYTYILTACIQALVLALRPENYVNKARFLMIAFFPILPGIAGMLQLYFWRMPANCIGSTLASVIIYLNAISDQVSLEPLTGINNKRNFITHLERYMNDKDTRGDLYVLIMDMDHFKGINDTYGHMEGDNAIIKVAEILRNSVNAALLRSSEYKGKQITFARFGGDEFVAALVGAKEDADFLKTEMKRQLEVYNSASDKEYKLQISIGIAHWSEEMRGVKDFLTKADEELYIEKKEVRAER